MEPNPNVGHDWPPFHPVLSRHNLGGNPHSRPPYHPSRLVLAEPTPPENTTCPLDWVGWKDQILKTDEIQMRSLRPLDCPHDIRTCQKMVQSTRYLSVRRDSNSASHDNLRVDHIHSDTRRQTFEANFPEPDHVLGHALIRLHTLLSGRSDQRLDGGIRSVYNLLTQVFFSLHFVKYQCFASRASNERTLIIVPTCNSLVLVATPRRAFWAVTETFLGPTSLKQGHLHYKFVALCAKVPGLKQMTQTFIESNFFTTHTKKTLFSPTLDCENPTE